VLAAFAALEAAACRNREWNVTFMRSLSTACSAAQLSMSAVDDSHCGTEFLLPAQNC
jgi:hypothetical protein